MKNDNKTVKQVCGEFKTSRHTCKNCDFEVCPSIIVFADRIIAAHEREMNALAAQKTAEAHEAFVKNAELADAIAVKDAEIEKLRALVCELADALLSDCEETCDYCKKYLNIGEASERICLHNHQCNVGQAYRRLVAKARKVIGGYE